MRVIVSILLAGCLAGCGVAVPAGMIGFRGDGAGIFPADCHPPTEFDALTGKNLVWKTPLPNFGNGSPIVVGTNVFVVCEAGWPAGEDCALLLCYDAETGKERWRRALDEFTTMPEARAKQAREVRAEYWRRIRRLNTLLYMYQTADVAQKEAILQEASRLGVTKASDFERWSWGTGSAEQAVWRDKALGQQLREVCAYDPITWSPTTLGVAMPTPVSDGRRVYVYTGRRTVTAFDLDGNKLWDVWQSGAPYNYHWVTDCANSPLLVDGLLLMYVFDHLWAYDTATGALRWTTESLALPGDRHAMGTPVLLRLPTLGGQTEPALFLWTGDVVRLRDGKVLVRDVTAPSCGEYGGNGRDMIWGALQKGTSGKQWDAIRFSYANDAVEVQPAWSVSARKLGVYPIFSQGRILTENSSVLDAATGEMLFDGAAYRNAASLCYDGIILAGDHLYGLPKSSINAGSGGASGLGQAKDIVMTCAVAALGADRVERATQCPVEFLPAKITEPAKRDQVVAMTGRDRYCDWYGWHEAYSAPFASGNRLFVRTFDALYCFGDPAQPFTPSQAFAAETESRK